MEDTTALAEPDRVCGVVVTSLKFSRDGSVLAAGTNLGQVKLFDTRTGELFAPWTIKNGRTGGQKHSGKTEIASASDGKCRIAGVFARRQPVGRLRRLFADVPLVPNGIRRLGESTTGPGRLKVWDVKTGTLKFDLVGHDSHADAVAFSPDGNLLASAGNWRDANKREPARSSGMP